MKIADPSEMLGLHCISSNITIPFRGLLKKSLVTKNGYSILLHYTAFIFIPRYFVSDIAEVGKFYLYKMQLDSDNEYIQNNSLLWIILLQKVILLALTLSKMASWGAILINRR